MFVCHLSGCRSVRSWPWFHLHFMCGMDANALNETWNNPGWSSICTPSPDEKTTWQRGSSTNALHLLFLIIFTTLKRACHFISLVSICIRCAYSMPRCTAARSHFNILINIFLPWRTKLQSESVRQANNLEQLAESRAFCAVFWHRCIVGRARAYRLLHSKCAELRRSSFHPNGVFVFHFLRCIWLLFRSCAHSIFIRQEIRIIWIAGWRCQGKWNECNQANERYSAG